MCHAHTHARHRWPQSVLREASRAVIGHVDSGKSTTTGHLIYKCGGVSDGGPWGEASGAMVRAREVTTSKLRTGGG